MNQIKNNPNDIPVLTALTDDQVADYLRRYPHFLMDKPDLLADMVLPHPTQGQTISLIERQVSVLRERNMDMRHRLSQLLDNARINDHLFERSRRLILAMLGTRQFHDCLDALFYSFQNDFDIHYARLLLINPKHASFPSPVNKQAVVVGRQYFEESLPDVLHQQRTICGQLGPDECQFIFREHAAEIGSTAVAPLWLDADCLGVLAVANRKPSYYRSSMNTLFLNFIADVLCHFLDGFLEERA